MTKILYKKIIIFFLILLSLLSAVNIPVTAKADSVNAFDNTNVLDDLRSSESFNILKYPFTESKDIQIINFVEYCYSFRANMRDNYGLYVYIYNPKGLNLDTGDANFIQMAVSYDENGNPTDYEKFGLKYLSKAEESNYKNLFYKFKVIDREINGTTFFDRVNSNERRYDVSGIELLTYGKNLATEYNVAGSFRFTGYAKGYGSDEDAESTLNCDVKELETITLQTHSTYYRTGEYARNHKHDLTSVYFSVPNRFFETYGALQKIKAEWYEYQTTPIVITSNSAVYDLLYPYIGVNVNDNTNIPIQIYTGYQEMVGSNGHYDKYDWAYNCNYTDAVNTRCNEINYLFSTEGKDISEYVLSSARLKSYVESYTKTYKNGRISVPGKNISADLFESGLSPERTAVPYVGNVHHKLVDFDAGDTFDMLNYSDTNSAWKQFFAGLFGLAPRELDESYKGISPIRIVTDSDMAKENLARTLLINGSESELNAFKSFYNNAKNNNETVVLFRFAQTDYMCLPVMCYNCQTGKNLDKNGLFDSADYGESTYVVSESVFLNFDIIQLTFNKDGVYTVIPVVNSPIDIYNDITLPKKETSWWKTLLMYLLLILLLILLAATGVLPLILKGIVWVILLPFRFIAAIIKSIKKRKERER
ncbi:MAG: hypothetical protein SPL13_04335 [Clostridia bacterium]|nr:hypothetical protein [Clostridia bacterium]